MPSDRPNPFFVGNHPALDFLNTVATPQGTVIDWLCSGQDLVEWLEAAGLIDPATAARAAAWKPGELEKAAAAAREFRDWLRAFVMVRKGKPLRITAATLAPLNQILSQDRSIPQIELARGRGKADTSYVLRRTRRWESPAELLAPLAEAAADLVCNQDFRLIRACQGSRCCLLFLDRTKGHARRWCSMAICGNRAKVEAFRSRKSRR